MNANVIASLDGRLEAVITEHKILASKSHYGDLSDLSGQDHQRLITMARAAITGVAGTHSTYYEQIEYILTRKNVSSGDHVGELVGVVEALRKDLTAGYLQSATELIHGEVFGDFLEMSSHLLDEGYKDASAVIAGSALEGHLRQLCQRHQISIEINNAGQTKPKKADQINSDLAKATVYSKLDQKNVTAWLDLRNNAAHGKYAAYTADQVRLMVDAVRDFVTRNPA